MKELLEKVASLRKPANESHVAHLITYLGDAPSIATIEEVLSYYKREEKRILTEDLLEWMMEKDLTNFETDDVKVVIKTYVNAKLEDTERAFDWLTAHEYGDLIKTTVDFPKGEFTTEAQSALEEMGLSFSMKNGVHPQTLKKVISDRLAAGEDLPDEDNGIKVTYFDECQVKEK